MDQFKLVSDYHLSGDQPEAVQGLVNGVNWGLREQTLLGVTGSGKTFTMASVIEKLNRPTLVLAHNKTLAASFVRNFGNFSRTMRWNTSFPTTIIISRRHILPTRTPISKRMRL